MRTTNHCACARCRIGGWDNILADAISLNGASEAARRLSCARSNRSGGVLPERRLCQHSGQRPTITHIISVSGGQDDPLNLSISVSGGKENNNDSPSSGERSGKSSKLKSRRSSAANCRLKTAIEDAGLGKVHWNVAPQRVRAPLGPGVRPEERQSTSRVVWECSSKRVVDLT